MIKHRDSFQTQIIRNTILSFSAALSVVIFLTSTAVMAAPPARQTSPNAESLKPNASDADEVGTLPERIDVQTMKRRYWTVGNEDLMDVVQNRLYTKKGRVEAAFRYGFWSDDPFQDQSTMALSVGYHLSEFLSLHGFYGKISASNNGAFAEAKKATALGNYAGLDSVVNPGTSVMGAEARASLIYGKLSLLGSRIIYYDLNVAGGVSQHKTRDGSSSIGFFAGLGQQFFLTKTFFLTVDYRLLFHTDKFQNPPVTQRSLTTNWIQIGVGVFAF